MKNTIGTSVALTIFGESHGEYIGCVIDGLAPGIEINENYKLSSSVALASFQLLNSHICTVNAETEGCRHLRKFDWMSLLCTG